MSHKSMPYSPNFPPSQGYAPPPENEKKDETYPINPPTQTQPGYPSGPVHVASSFQPGMQPGFQPGMQPGFQPGMSPGFQPGMQPGFQPGMTPGFQPGFQPGYQPGLQPGYPQPGYSPGPVIQQPVPQGPPGNKHFFLILCYINIFFLSILKPINT